MSEDEKSEWPRRIGVALSGGGHRATLFSLGVLLYLVEAGLNERVETISSVSGGSITNGYIAQECDFRSVTPQEFRRVANRLARVIAFRGTVLSSSITWLYLAFVVTLVVGAGVAGFISRGPVRVITLIVLLILLGIALGLRGFVVAAAFGRVLFAHGPVRTALANINDSVCHVICSTDLFAADPFYFSGQFIMSPTRGWSPPQSVKLQTAVQASAAFPGAFPPRRLKTRKIDWTSQNETDRASAAQLKEWGWSPALYLVDGGVYNNLGISWFDGLNPAMRSSSPYSLPDAPELLIVVNSSAGTGARAAYPSIPMKLPFLRELAFIPQVMDVLYANTVQPRIDAIERETNAHVVDHRLRQDKTFPAVIPIQANSWRLDHLWEAVSGHGEVKDFWEARIKSDNEFMTSLAYLFTDLNNLVVFSDAHQIPTTLRRLGRKQTELLIRHGYASAMLYLHILMDGPLFDLKHLDDVVESLLQKQ